MINFLFKRKRYYIYSKWNFDQQYQWVVYKKFKNKSYRDLHFLKLNRGDNKVIEYSKEDNSCS